MLSQLTIVSLIIAYSQLFGVSPEVSLAVADVESGYNQNALGPTGDVGVFQLRPSSFPKFSRKDLLNPYVNIPLGVQFLKQMKNTCVHKVRNTYLVCYNYGIKNASKVKHPELFPYVKLVNKKIKEHRGYKVVDFQQ